MVENAFWWYMILITLAVCTAFLNVEDEDAGKVRKCEEDN